jgi:hypothetical protein
VVNAFAEFGDFIAGEVLATTVRRDDCVTTGPTDIDGLAVRLHITAT